MRGWPKVMLVAAGVVSTLLCAMAAAGLKLAGAGWTAPAVMLALLLMAVMAFAHALRQPRAVSMLMLLSVAPFAGWLVYHQMRHGFDPGLAGLAAALLAAVPAGIAGGRWLEARVRPWRPLHSVAALFTLAAVLLLLIAPLLTIFRNANA